jgi:hypothetical protein
MSWLGSGTLLAPFGKLSPWSLPMATVCSLTSPRGGPGVLTVGDGLKSPVAEVEVSKAIPSFEAEGVGQAFFNT